MANNLIERDMRERLFALAAAWLELAGELERQAAEYEELLSALRLHFSGASVSPTKHWHGRKRKGMRVSAGM
jgi:hypothetical protein